VDIHARIFDLSATEKAKLVAPDPETYPYGYVPFQGETLTRGKAAEEGAAASQTYGVGDLNENWSVGPEDPRAGMPPRVWPTSPPSFAKDLGAYYAAMDELSQALLRGFAVALGKPESFFDSAVAGHRSALRLLNYPAQTVPPPPNSIRASEHTDYGSLTILRTDAPGLQVRNRAGDWIDVDPSGDVFIVNLGDLMARWTNGAWLSTPHRVINPATLGGNRRMSMVYFQNVSADTIIDSATFAAPGTKPKYPPIRAHDFLMAKHLAAIGKK
jgi:isopenicillin N synthase-like dioxygenase